MKEAERTRRWLAEQGVVEVEPGVWDDNGKRLDASEMAHAWGDEATGAEGPDGEWDPAHALELSFGLLDLLQDYWVTCEIGWLLKDEPSLTGAFWDGCRRRLEGEVEPEALLYSLWVDWFEDMRTVEGAFAEVLGNDVAALGSPDEALARRARRVLKDSGPVPWELKRPVYEVASGVPALRGAVFRGLLHSYHDVHGKLQPQEALDLLRRLELPAGTEHLAELRAVLEAGHVNHYRSPDAWSG